MIFCQLDRFSPSKGYRFERFIGFFITISIGFDQINKSSIKHIFEYKRGQKIKKSQHQNPSNPCHTMSSSQNKKSRFTNPRKELRTPTQNIEPYMTNLNQKNLRENKSIYEGTEEIESSYFDRMGREFPSVEKVSM
jgi:hypothetical protein